MQTSSQTIGKHSTTLNLSSSSLQLLSVLWNDMPRKNYIHLNYHKVAFPGFFLTLMYDIYKRTNIWKLFYIFTKQVNCGLKGGRGKLIRNPYFVSVQIPLTCIARVFYQEIPHCVGVVIFEDLVIWALVNKRRL